MTTIKDYLRKENCKPAMTVAYSEQHVGGRIYCIGTPKITKYKYVYQVKTNFKSKTGKPVYDSYRISYHDYCSPNEHLQKLADKGWKLTFIHPYNGYEIYCLEKTETPKTFTLPSGNIVGCVYNHAEGIYNKLLNSAEEIEEYMRDYCRGFGSIDIYKVPDSVTF